MRTSEIVDGLTAFRGRGAGRDPERRAAVWLAGQLNGPERQAEVQTFWCRPQWPLAQAWHVALAIAGSLVAVGHAKVGTALLLVAILSVIADVALGISPGRRLTPERASQNVVARPSRGGGAQVELIVTANLDAGRSGVVHRNWLRRPVARLRTGLAGGRAPGWAAWLVLAMAWVLGIALARVRGAGGGAVSAAQLPPTIVLVVALALLLELGSGAYTPGAGDNASGVAVAVALARALDAAPPASLSVTLVLSGAGDAQGIGLRRHLRGRRGQVSAANTVVLGIGPCGEGSPRWLAGDGQLFPLAFFAGLRRLAAAVAAADPNLELREQRNRGCSPALPARMRGLPAITLDCADVVGLAPRSHQTSDTPERVDAQAPDRLLAAALMLVDELDAYVAGRTRG
jgi:hypothetical protein